jgi:hypothetical protein
LVIFQSAFWVSFKAHFGYLSKRILGYLFKAHFGLSFQSAVLVNTQVGDTVGAVESLSKSINAFSACEGATMYSLDGIEAVKKVMDFGFHDVECLVRLAREAIVALGH